MDTSLVDADPPSTVTKSQFLAASRVELLKVFPVSSADCERGFSQMNLHNNSGRNMLHVSSVNDLLMSVSMDLIFIHLMQYVIYQANTVRWISRHDFLRLRWQLVMVPLYLCKVGRVENTLPASSWCKKLDTHGCFF